MNILITGAAGFIGSHLAQQLEKQGHQLTLIDDFSRGNQDYLDYLGVKTECLNFDLKDYGVSKVHTKDIDIVFHAACRVGGEQFLHGSSQNEISTLQENLIIDTNVFKACVLNNVDRIIYTSSVSVYNTSRQYSGYAKFDETDFDKYIEPEGGYGWAKYMGEKQLQLISDIGTKVGVVRIFKSYGPCDDFSEQRGLVVCSLMRKAIQYPKQPFEVWGDGSVTRNLVYVEDLVDGLIKLSKYKKSLTVNMGGKESISIKELAEQIVLLSGKNIDISYINKKTNSPLSRIPNLELVKQKLNWEPTTPFYKGLQKTYEWMKLVCR